LRFTILLLNRETFAEIYSTCRGITVLEIDIYYVHFALLEPQQYPTLFNWFQKGTTKRSPSIAVCFCFIYRAIWSLSTLTRPYTCLLF